VGESRPGRKVVYTGDTRPLSHTPLSPHMAEYPQYIRLCGQA
jgi:hypothetical protein